MWHAGKSAGLSFPGLPKKLEWSPASLSPPRSGHREEAEGCFSFFFYSTKRSRDAGVCISADGNTWLCPGVISLLAALTCIILLRVGLGRRETGMAVCV